MAARTSALSVPRPARRSDSATRERLLDAAERLFAEKGLGASVRAITGAARANVAAVTYHFGGRQGLLDAVCERHLAPLERERCARLDALPRPHDVPAVLSAFIAPALERVRPGPGGDAFLRLLGRIHAESSDLAERISQTWFRPSVARFLVVLAPLLPHLTPATLRLRFHFMIGSLARAGAAFHRLPRLCGQTFDQAEITAALVAFAAAGMQAPVVSEDR